MRGIIRRHPALATLIGVVLIGSCVAGSLAVRSVTLLVSDMMPRNDSDREIEAAKVAGDTILARIDAFTSEQGHYPETLDALVVFDGEPIPPCPAGMQAWSYSRFEDGQRFALRVCFTPDCYPVLFWDSKGGGWRYDT